MGMENKSENSMVIYTKEDKIEALKVIPDANKNVNVYHHDQILGKAGIEATAACSGGMARKVHILDKNGMLVCMLEMPQFGYDIAVEEWPERCIFLTKMECLSACWKCHNLVMT